MVLWMRCAKNMKSENLDARWSIKTIQVASTVLLYTQYIDFAFHKHHSQCLLRLFHQTVHMSIYFTVIYLFTRPSLVISRLILSRLCFFIHIQITLYQKSVFFWRNEMHGTRIRGKFNNLTFSCYLKCFSWRICSIEKEKIRRNWVRGQA